MSKGNQAHSSGPPLSPLFTDTRVFRFTTTSSNDLMTLFASARWVISRSQSALTDDEHGGFLLFSMQALSPGVEAHDRKCLQSGLDKTNATHSF